MSDRSSTSVNDSGSEVNDDESEYSESQSSESALVLRLERTIANLQKKNLNYKKTNNHLKRNNYALRQKLRFQAILKQRDAQLGGLVANLRSSFQPLPTGVLHSIMQYAIPPSFLLDPSISRGPDSPWCRAMDMRIALTRVNKAWYHAALPLLYGEIVFRHIGPIAAFLDTLRITKNSSDLAAMVKSIHVLHPISPGFGEFLRESLLELSGNCPRLSSLGVVAIDGVVPSVVGIPLTVLDIGFRLPKSIVDDDEEDGDEEITPFMHVLVHVSRTLSTLKLRWCIREGGRAVENLEFPCLKQLHIISSMKSLPNITQPKPMLHFLARWRFPNLEHLHQHSPNEISPESRLVFEFLRHHGASLKYLQFEDPYGDIIPDTVNLQELLDACPLLEHIVIPGDLHQHIVLHHDSLKLIDVCLRISPRACCGSPDWDQILPKWGRRLVECSDNAGQKDLENQLPYMQSSLPRLEAIRAVDNVLDYLPDILEHIKPPSATDSPSLIAFDGICFVNTFNALYQIDMAAGDGLEGFDTYIDKYCPVFSPDSDEEVEDGDSDASWYDSEVDMDAIAMRLGYLESAGRSSEFTANTVREMYRGTLHTD